MSYLDAYKNRIKNQGESVRGSLIKSTKEYLLNNFSSSPSFQQIMINEQIDLTGVHILDDSQTKEQKKVVSPFNEIKNGDILHWKDQKWITIIVDTLETHWRAVIKKCESSLKWLNADGIIKETPFTQKFTSTAYPLQEDKIMILSKERRTILIQSNDDTKQIKKDKRFIFDDRCWKVVGYNGLVEGLLELTLEEDQLNETVDNIPLQIADYYGKAANYKVQILNGVSGSIALDDKLQLNIRVTNNDSIVNPPLHFTSSDESIVTVDGDGLITPLSVGEAVITVECSGVTSVFALHITERRVYNYTLDIIGNSEIKMNQTQDYRVIFYNNGTPIYDNAVFTLTSVDGSPTTLATVKSNTENICSISAGKTIGKILLQVSNLNGLITGSKEIKIKSLI